MAPAIPADAPEAKQASHPRSVPWSGCVLAAFLAASGSYQWVGGAGPGCGGQAEPGVVYRALLHNRWNVFATAEPYAVWEVAPARLSDGSVVDIWWGTDQVPWAVPSGGEPRGGRWRSWPYTAERSAEADACFWQVLCDEWRDESGRGRTVERFRFYMLHAPILPGRPLDEGYGEVRKRLIRSFECTTSAP